MTKLILFTLILFSPTTLASVFSRLKTRCLEILIQDDPYQVALEKAATENLVREFRTQAGRRFWRPVTTDEYEMSFSQLLIRLASEPLPVSDRRVILEALRDYPDARALSLMRQKVIPSEP